MPLSTQADLIEVIELPQVSPALEFMETPEETIAEMPEASWSEPQEQVEECEPVNMELTVDELPGVEGLDPELEKALEVVEEKENKEEKSDKDENDAKTKKNSKWDWDVKGFGGFIGWLQERLRDVPKHSGYDLAGVERAIAYMEKLDNEISKAMRADLDGELDADKIEEVRAKIDDGIERLHARLEKIKKKPSKRRKRSEEENSELVKQAQKIPSVHGIVITVPLLISGICRTVVNGMVSGGHSAEDMLAKLADKYKLSDRERMECIYHLQDMGMVVRRDRGIMLDEEFDATSPNNFDFNANWPA